jgi:hypothetical protein
MGGRALDYNKDCKYNFGAYVQANQDNDPTNTNLARTIDCIYLRPANNAQGGHELMNLSTGLVLSRARCWEIPVTDKVIAIVEPMAEKQGINTLKLQSRDKKTFFPADWVAGVDYDAEDGSYDTDVTAPETESEDDDYDAEGYDHDDELSDEDTYDRVSESEISDLLDEQEAPPVRMVRTAPPMTQEEIQVETVSDDDADDEMDDMEYYVRTGRPRRTVRKPDVLTYTHAQVKGEQKNVKFQDQERIRLEQCHNLVAQSHPNPEMDTEYSPSMAMIIAQNMAEINAKAKAEGASFGQQYIYQKGVKIFKERGKAAGSKELDQLHQRNCFTPIDISEMSFHEKRKAVEALMFLNEKRDGTVKGRLVYNGKPTREWLNREDSASPTAALESIQLTAVIDAAEGRDVMSNDVPNAFIQAHMPPVEDGEDRVIMKITGVLVQLLVEQAPEVYGPYVVYEDGKRVLYVQVLRALYGMLIASLLWYKKFRKELEEEGYIFNPYDPCVANKQIKGTQHTIRFHVDDRMCSHLLRTMNDKFNKWLNKMYGNQCAVKCVRGKVHDYLGMTFVFDPEHNKGGVDIDMSEYMTKMSEDFSVQFKPSETAETPQQPPICSKLGLARNFHQPRQANFIHS